jgi:hypothetical protein
MIFATEHNHISDFPPAVIAQRIRNLRIYAEYCGIPSPPETFFESGNALQWIVRPSETECRRIRTSN